MARLVTAGFEIEVLQSTSTTGTPDGEKGGTGVVSRDTTIFRSGVASKKHVGSATDNPCTSWNFTTALGRTSFFRTYMQIDAYPSGTTQIGRFFGSGTNVVVVSMTAAGAIRLQDGSAVQIGSDSTVLSLGVWYRVELSCLINTGATDAAELRLDGVTVASTSGATLTDTLPTEVRFGWNQPPGVASNMYLDDVALNDSTGAAQTSWPGGGKVVLAKPISDNARTAGWVTGAGGTTSLFDAVDNTPPVGAADTGTATSQIRNATAEASASYDANLTTYTNLGIGAADTINVVDPVVATAAPVATSAKQGLIGMASNPAITTVALGATGTAGAFWSGVTAGTYPTGWKWSHGTTTYVPSVTKGSSPVARITQVTSSTRIADVCFLGMYVDYTPAIVPRALAHRAPVSVTQMLTPSAIYT